MPETERERVTITVLCWIRKPGSEARCCLPPGHHGDHHHWYGGGHWPRRAGETQAS
ncbi:hypothetical protein [Streptomyces sp. NPDC047123]|uniref:hypothetical protein n=1 Tax=Streptomyces sp. NPDC047123 TaxID=3155622 RepID=UPI0033DBA070